MTSKIIYAVALVLVASYFVRPSEAVLSDNDKYEILRAHNIFRSRATPTPTDMVALVRESTMPSLPSFFLPPILLFVPSLFFLSYHSKHLHQHYHHHSATHTITTTVPHTHNHHHSATHTQSPPQCHTHTHNHHHSATHTITTTVPHTQSPPQCHTHNHHHSATHTHTVTHTQ